MWEEGHTFQQIFEISKINSSKYHVFVIFWGYLGIYWAS